MKNPSKIITGISVIIIAVFTFATLNQPRTDIRALSKEYEKILTNQENDRERLLELDCQMAAEQIRLCMKDRTSNYCSDAQAAIENFITVNEEYFEYACLFQKDEDSL